MTRYWLQFAIGLAFALSCAPGYSRINSGPWIPLFKGIDYCSATNTPDNQIRDLQVAHTIRVDLRDPDIHFKTTPRLDFDYISGDREVVGYSPSDFLLMHNLSAVINANFVDFGTYYPPPGTVMDILGLSIDQGEVVSQELSSHAATFLFDATNKVTFIPTNWPPVSTEGVVTAVAGNMALVVNGVNVASSADPSLDPRTFYGITEDRRYLYIIALDGRQPGYSDGASFRQGGEWLLFFGAYNGANLDGGGSTTLVIRGTTGDSIPLNKSSAVAGNGRERVIGSHFGIYAKPLPGFINEVQSIPGETSAIVKWTTTEEADSRVRYGQTQELELGSLSDEVLTTNHQITIPGLAAATKYYFQVLSAQHSSSNFAFVTTNYVSTNKIFDINKQWRYTSQSMIGIDWTKRDYNDSGWAGRGPGILWADSRTTPNPAVPFRMTRLGVNTAVGFPYISYYFRTTFVITNLPVGSTLEFSGYIDDGAAIYINGVKTYSLRLPEDPINSTLADGFPCAGDATCLDQFIILAESNTNLVVGTNVVAVEVHNYNERSPDITFGLALSRIEKIERVIQLNISRAADKVMLEWSSPAALQSASSVEGPWEDVSPAPESPVALDPSGTSHFYRLRRLDDR